MSNTSLSEFINACAKLMRADRPLLWDNHEDAVLDVTAALSDATALDPEDWEEYSVHLSGFVLTRIVLDDGVFEYTMSKKLVSLGIYTDDEESGVFDWTKDSQLLKGIELNLPEIEEELDIEPDIIDDIYYDEDYDE